MRKIVWAQAIACKMLFDQKGTLISSAEQSARRGDLSCESWTLGADAVDLSDIQAIDELVARWAPIASQQVESRYGRAWLERMSAQGFQVELDWGLEIKDRDTLRVVRSWFWNELGSTAISQESQLPSDWERRIAALEEALELEKMASQSQGSSEKGKESRGRM